MCAWNRSCAKAGLSKHSDNVGGVATSGNVPQTFSHFTYQVGLIMFLQDDSVYSVVLNGNQTEMMGIFLPTGLYMTRHPL